MKSSFIACEVMRIFVPGFYFALLLFAYLKIFLIGSQPLILSHWAQGALFVFVVFVAGLTMYAQETPKRRKAFRQNQPSLYLKTLSQRDPSLPPLSENDARKVYFYILNNHIPERFHEKIFFFGAISMVILQIRRTSLWFMLLALIALGISLTSFGFFISSLPRILYFVLVGGIYLLTVRYNKAERKIQENYEDQIFWLQMNSALVLDILRHYPVEKGTHYEN